ncbi:MAG: DUF2336 domain-containing protein [Hyphomicrobiales bacterium]|nr:DUF2336 domain-containing protein [Hyphomicrobiales bacterium]
MIVRKFMLWAATAPAAERAEGAGSLARAYLYSGLDANDRREAEIALTALLDDASPLVRKALAEAFASSPDAPRAIVAALANDQSEIAAPVLGRSPLLGDGDLIDAAAIGDAFAQAAIALRPQVSNALAAAIAEVGAREALIALTVNPGADIPEFSMRRMIERFGDDGELREALLGRGELPGSVRSDLVMAAGAALSRFVVGCNWLPRERADRAVREASEKAHVILAAETEQHKDWRGARALAAHLRNAGRLTPGLVLRSLLSGDVFLFEAAVVELSGLPQPKALALARDWRGAGFASLYRTAGLPERLLPVFRSALDARRTLAPQTGSANLSRAMIERVLTATEQGDPVETAALTALLRRFDAEAAREEAREAARVMFEEQLAPPVSIEAAPESEEGAPRLIDIDLDAIEAELAAA